jgi:hypothetical protein
MSIFVRWTRAAVGAALLLALATLAHAQVPNLLNYQGFVAVGGANFTGSGQFRFALVNAAGTTTFWSNDGTSVGGGQPATAVTLAVSGGVFSVVLGTAPMTAIPATVFTANSDVRLRVWFDDGSHGVQLLAPDQRVVAGAYAIRAGSADALAASASVPAVQITGTVTSAQIADGSVTKPKLSAAGGSAGQVLGTDGSNLQWQSAGGAGTVTSLAQGAGITLAPNPIVASGTVAADVAYLQRRVIGTCAAGSSIRTINPDGTVVCETDDVGSGTVTSITAGAGLTGGTITTSGTIAVDAAALTFTDKFFLQGGNAFGGIASAVLGTTNNLALDVIVNNTRAFRLEPYTESPNVIGGHGSNTRDNAFGNIGSVIAGGGKAGADCLEPSDGTSTRSCANQVKGNYSVVGGGFANRAGGDFSIVVGGQSNSADSFRSFIGGGSNNIASGSIDQTIGGGFGNKAGADRSTVGGGFDNTASSQNATVGGGHGNVASGPQATVGGGLSNVASGQNSTVAGGGGNTASGNSSFAAGRLAMTQTADAIPIVHDGTFVFSDISGGAFRTTTSNEFAVRATGGVRFVTAIDVSDNPTRTVKINGNGELDFGTNNRQMLNLWGPAQYGIGVQPATLYFRTGTGATFSWFDGGAHVNGPNQPGPGGTEIMRLDSNGDLNIVGTFGALSDRAAKQDFAAVDSASVLERLVRMPISSWVYRANPSVRHIGPTAQDFRAAFGLGNSHERSIATVDADGVALAAIQGLNAKLEERLAQKEARIAALESELTEVRATQRSELAELRRAVERLAARSDSELALANR